MCKIFAIRPLYWNTHGGGNVRNGLEKYNHQENMIFLEYKRTYIAVSFVAIAGISRLSLVIAI
jgi:hypothetical protein